MTTPITSDTNVDKVEQTQPDEYAVEAILEKRLINEKAEYLIKWKGFDA